MDNMPRSGRDYGDKRKVADNKSKGDALAFLIEDFYLFTRFGGLKPTVLSD